MKKLVKVCLGVGLATFMLTACVSDTPSSNQAPTATPTATPTAPASNNQEDSSTSASPKESADPKALLDGLSANGFWIFSILDDVTLNETLHVDGIFYDKDNTESRVYRKLALYSQDSDRNVTAEFTLTVPEISVTSPNFLIQYGTVKGDIKVNAEGFTLTNTTVEGNLEFATQEQFDSANISDGTVTGAVTVAGADATASASPKESSDPAALLNGLSEDGFWIFSITDDVTLTEPLNVDGVFYDKDNTESRIYRKLALYAQDSDRNVTAEYTLTVPNMFVTSPNFLIQYGTVVGNIYVDAEGFTITNATIEGDIMFETQEQLDSASIDTATITGEVIVK